MYRALQRDPYARATLYKLIIKRSDTYGAPTCTWCGNGPANAAYAWIRDTVGEAAMEQILHSAKRFCSVGCYRSYEP